MFEYNIIKLEIENPTKMDIITQMDEFGEDGWEVFQVDKITIEEWTRYGDPQKLVEYTFYMKRKIEK